MTATKGARLIIGHVIWNPSLDILVFPILLSLLFSAHFFSIIRFHLKPMKYKSFNGITVLPTSHT